MAFLTGVNTAYIAIAFPVLLPLIQHLPNYFYLSLYIYVIGYAGILVSPLHLCLVLTNEYFEASLLEVYRYMADPHPHHDGLGDGAGADTVKNEVRSSKFDVRLLTAVNRVHLTKITMTFWRLLQ